MRRDWPFLFLLWLLILSNLVWAYKYRQLWLDDAQANAWLDWDREYMRDMDTHEFTLRNLLCGDQSVTTYDGLGRVTNH